MNSPQSGDQDGEPMQQQLAKAAETQADAGEGGAVSDPSSPGFDLQGKLIIDLKDPNRPRFTLQELRQVRHFFSFFCRDAFFLSLDRNSTREREIDQHLLFYH